MWLVRQLSGQGEIDFTPQIYFFHFSELNYDRGTYLILKRTVSLHRVKGQLRNWVS